MTHRRPLEATSRKAWTLVIGRTARSSQPSRSPVRMYDWPSAVCRDMFNPASGALMQTLNVGAGRSDEEYKAAEQQRRADLRAESINDANYFFLAAALAGLGTGLFPLRVGIFVNIGAIDLLALYAHVRSLVVTGVAAG